MSCLTSVSLPNALEKQLMQWAEAAFPEECCGLLFGESGNISNVQQARNVATDKTRMFEIDPATLLSAQKQARAGGPALLGYFHSHPNGRSKPSALDAEMAAADGRIWLIVTSVEITAWQACADGELHRRFQTVELILSENS